jgi:hypothetical protein
LQPCGCFAVTGYAIGLFGGSKGFSCNRKGFFFAGIAFGGSSFIAQRLLFAKPCLGLCSNIAALGSKHAHIRFAM